MTPSISPDTTRPTTRKVPPTERELLLFARAGDKRAKEVIVKRYLPLVHGVTRKYASLPVDREDLVQEGCLGLLKATEGFDLDRNLKFSTYARWWVLNYVQKHINKTSRTIYLPRSKTYNTVDYPTCNNFGDLGIFDHEPLFPSMEDVEGEVMNDDIVSTLHEAIKHLSDIERRVVASYYGIGCDRKPDREIAEDESFSKQRINDLRLNAQRKLRGILGEPSNVLEVP